MCVWVIRIIAIVFLTMTARASAEGRVAGDMSNLPPRLDDIGDEYIGIEVRRSTGLREGEPGSVGEAIRPTDASGKAFPTRKVLRDAGKLDPNTDLPINPATVPAFWDEDQKQVFFHGKRYDFKIPTTAAVDSLIGVKSSPGSTRQAINLTFFRPDDPTSKPQATHYLSALIVDDTSSQTINVIVPRPKSLVGTRTKSGVVYVPVYVPYYIFVPACPLPVCGYPMIGLRCR